MRILVVGAGAVGDYNLLRGRLCVVRELPKRGVSGHRWLAVVRYAALAQRSRQLSPAQDSGSLRPDLDISSA
jgi:hypothetical protein